MRFLQLDVQRSSARYRENKLCALVGCIRKQSCTRSSAAGRFPFRVAASCSRQPISINRPLGIPNPQDVYLRQLLEPAVCIPLDTGETLFVKLHKYFGRTQFGLPSRLFLLVERPCAVDDPECCCPERSLGSRVLRQQQRCALHHLHYLKQGLSNALPLVPRCRNLPSAVHV